jgi:FlaA1/EpsC-like NDP-sugar epimerase
VVEILIDAAQRGRALTVTDPAATRYFMTAAEAVSLVLSAATLARPREIFWLDMGEPLRLADLVDRIVAAFTPPGAIPAPVEVIGLRPGEKLHESLTSQDLPMEPTREAGIWSAGQPVVERSLLWIERLRRACRLTNPDSVLRVLRDAVPGYEPSAEAIEAARIVPYVQRPRLRPNRRSPSPPLQPAVSRYA